jgi:hypothetical protein
MSQDSGAGVSTDHADNLVPMVYLLQALSPQVNKRKTDVYIDGAEPGMFWLRSCAEPLADGETGFLFQPCWFYKDVVEWVPRDDGGGLVSRYDEMPEDAIREEDEKTKKVKFTSPRGTEYVDTRYHCGFVIHPTYGAMPYVISLSSTGHTASKEFMFKMNQQQLPNGVKAPSYANVYRVTSRERTRNELSWFTWNFDIAYPVVRDMATPKPDEVAAYRRGKALFTAFSTGMKVAEAPDVAAMGEAQGGPSGDSENPAPM